jgi:acetate kinase
MQGMQTILTINSGSSSLKASLFRHDGSRRNFHYRDVHNSREAFNRLMCELGSDSPDAVGHRLVHGGEAVDAARSIDATERERLENLIHLAPLHLPGNLLGVDMCMKHFNVPQFACFDTAFHATLPEFAWHLPIPADLNMRRYGFHGLNYAHVASVLPSVLGNIACGKIIVAHLGSGASLCLMEQLRSVDTTMGYSPAGGITMATRSGDLDPGIMLELSKRYSPEQLEDMVFHKMGLFALSLGESSEMEVLMSSSSERAKFAVDYFCRQVRAAIGSLAAKSGGIDALVFTGGIGEHSPQIRHRITEPLKFLGFGLNSEANLSGRQEIHSHASKPVLVIPADEERRIYELCIQQLELHSGFVDC